MTSAADLINDPVYKTVDLGSNPYPRKTGDARRWPDLIDIVEAANPNLPTEPPTAAIEAIIEYLQLAADLAAPVRFALTQFADAVYVQAATDDDWAVANIIDAAVDEQDRRDGKPWRGPRPEPKPREMEMFITGVAIQIPRAAK